MKGLKYRITPYEHMEIVESGMNCTEYRQVLEYLASVGLIKNKQNFDFSIKGNHE